VIAILLLALTTVSQAPVATVPMRTILKAPISQVDQARQMVVRTAEEWQKLWLGHSLPIAQTQPPAVDFSKEMVVAVFMGSRPTTGFAVDITGARVDGETLVVTYRETRPQPGMVQGQVVTSPCHMVAVPKRDGPVRFEKID